MDDYYIIYGRIFLLINCQFFLFVITRFILNECMEVCPPWVRVVMIVDLVTFGLFHTIIHIQIILQPYY